MIRPSRTRSAARAVALGAMLGAAGTLAGCLDTGLLLDAAFAPHIAGLSPGQPWTTLPVGAWIAESEIQPVAIAACLAGCEVRAVVARFRAGGRDAATLARLADDPTPLIRALSAPPRPPATASAGRRLKPVPPERRAVATATRLDEGAAHGFMVHLARPDGSRPAYGAVLATGRAADLSVLLVIADTEGAALRLARDVVAAGG